MRDMLLTMLVLAGIVLVLLGIRGGFSFSPGTASVDSAAAPKVDAAKYLRNSALDVRYPVRVPTVPSTWRANSAGVDTIGKGSQVQVGWITDQDGYLRLVQSNATTDELVKQAADNNKTPRAQDQLDVNGQRWTEYAAVRKEISWTTTVGDTRLLITGNASQQQFRTLAAAVGSAPVAPSHR